jgi:hypothetical protein
LYRVVEIFNFLYVETVSLPVMWLMCVVCFHMIARNPATRWRYGEPHKVQITVKLEYTMVQQVDYKLVF